MREIHWFVEIHGCTYKGTIDVEDNATEAEIDARIICEEMHKHISWDWNETTKRTGAALVGAKQ